MNRLFLSATLLLLGSSVQAATYYVAKTGSNTNTCAQAASQASPKLTISAGVGCLSAGDTLIVKSGAYSESIGSVPSGISEAQPTRVMAEPLLSVTMNVSGEDGFRFSGSSARYVLIKGFILEGQFSASNGISLYEGANYIEIHTCEIRNFMNQGIASQTSGSGSNYPHHIKVINCDIHSTSKGKICTGSGTKGGYCHGLYFGANDSLVDHNKLHDNNGFGIQVYPVGNRTVVSNNVVYNNRSSNPSGTNESVTGIFANGTGNQIFNNVVYGQDGGGIHVLGSGNSTHDNYSYNNGGGNYSGSLSGPNNLQTAPPAGFPPPLGGTPPPPPPPPPAASCDVNKDSSVNVVDVQQAVNQALGAACASDINQDGSCNVVDVQRVVNAALGGGCITGP